MFAHHEGNFALVVEYTLKDEEKFQQLYFYFSHDATRVIRKP